MAKGKNWNKKPVAKPATKSDSSVTNVVCVQPVLFDLKAVKEAQMTCVALSKDFSVRTMRRKVLVNDLLALTKRFPDMFQATWSDSRHYTFKCSFVVKGKEPVTSFTVKAIDGNSDNMLAVTCIRSAKIFLLDFIDRCNHHFNLATN